ncbi:hypothetical protein V8B97DRAFT_1876964 [Scleroderma yunnanense]
MTHSTGTERCVLHCTSPCFEHSTPLNIKTEVFSDFVSLEHPLPMGLNSQSPPLPPLLPSSSSPASLLNSIDESTENICLVLTLLHPHLFVLTCYFQTDKVWPAALCHAEVQAHCWSTALMAKKTAMENLLKAQQSLENIEESIVQCLSKESIEGAHAQFLSMLKPSDPEALYLLAVGWVFICPLSSHIRSA